MIFHFFFLVLLGGCSLAAIKPKALTTISQSAQQLAVPFISQDTENMCGVASLEMIARFYRQPILPEQLALLQESVDALAGSSGAQLKAALMASGYQALIFPGELGRQLTGLHYHLELERPLIVMIGPETKRHYMVLTGHDPESKRLFFHDPLNGEISFTEERFLDFWKTANYFTLLALPQTPPPVR